MAQITGNFPLDPLVIAQLPSGSRVIDASIQGSSTWAQTARIEVLLSDGNLKYFFIKCASEWTKPMIEGEYMSLLELYELNPEIVPKPHWWGQSDSRTVEQSSSRAVEQSSSRAVEQSSSRAVEQSSSRAVEQSSKRSNRTNETIRNEREKESERKRESGSEDYISQGAEECALNYVLLLEFRESSSDLPDPAIFGAWIAKIHRESLSPKGKFGFHTQNYQARVQQPISWEWNWATFFTKLLINVFNIETQTSSPPSEYQEAFKKLVDYTVPALLNPLQSNGRTLKPCLVHGNLSKGNIATSLPTGDPLIFSPSSLYAHNEYELGMWRLKMGKLDWSFFKHYLKNFPPSEPEDQWDDRIRLYSIKFNIAYMIGRPSSSPIREQIYEDMCHLNDKYQPPAS